MGSIIISSTLFIAICLLNVQFIASQAVTSCTQCRYGECEQLSYTFSCHCVMGVKGSYCDRLLENGENFCLSNPCWNGGICRSSGYSYTCECSTGFTGQNCRTVSSIQPAVSYPVTAAPNTVAPVTYPPIQTTPGIVTFPVPPVTPAVATTTQRVFFDKKVIVTNKGGYTAQMYLEYYNPTKVIQSGTITSGQSYAFYVPGNVDYNNGVGARLTVDAVGGNRVVNQLLMRNNPECVHVYGTTLNTLYSYVDC